MNEVDAKKLLADAEGKMTLWSKKKQEFATKSKRVEVYSKLATNDSLIWCNSMDDDTVVAGSVLGDKDDKGDKNTKPGESSPSSIATITKLQG